MLHLIELVVLVRSMRPDCHHIWVALRGGTVVAGGGWWGHSLQPGYPRAPTGRPPVFPACRISSSHNDNLVITRAATDYSQPDIEY